MYTILKSTLIISVDFKLRAIYYGLETCVMLLCLTY